jgi:HAD superfamily hydrolase (TIGR01490 family)
VKAAAFFDLDRTLMAGSSGLHWARAAYRAGMVGRRQMASDALANIKFRLRGSTDQETEAVKDRLGTFLAGKPVKDFERLGHQVLAGVLPRLYERMLQTAYAHQDEGRPVYIVTAATQDMADILAQVLGFDGAAGSKLEKRDGMYTGGFDGPFCYGSGKPIRMREIAERDGLDLATSWAYSDSASDLPMLRAVGHAVVVNPDPELAQVAKEEGWDVMRFETLGRRLKVGAAVLAAAAAGGGAATARGRTRR